MIDKSVIEKAARMLLQAAPPESKVILFGSYARGDAHENSDLDFLVIEPRLSDRRREMVRLADVLRPLRVPAEVLVVSRERFEYWRDTPNTLYYDAATEGRTYGQVG